MLEGDPNLVVDDVIATGGTLEAATSLIERMKAETIGIVSIMDLTFLGGSDKLRSKGYQVYSKRSSMLINILWASMFGNAEDVARNFEDIARKRNHEVNLIELNDVTPTSYKK